MAALSAEAEVRALIEAWVEAIRRRNLPAVLANHADGIVMYDVPEPVQIRGIEAYTHSWDEFLRWVKTFDFEDLEVVAGDDVAFCHGVVRCSGETEAAFPVRLTVGCRRIEGRWVVTHEHHSVPSPP